MKKKAVMRAAALFFAGILAVSGCGKKSQEGLNGKNFAEKGGAVAKALREQEGGEQKKQVTGNMLNNALGAAGGSDRVSGGSKKKAKTKDTGNQSGGEWAWLDAFIRIVDGGEASELEDLFSANAYIIDSVDEITGTWNVKLTRYAGAKEKDRFLTAEIGSKSKKVSVTFDQDGGGAVFSGKATIDDNNGVYLDLESKDAYLMITDFVDDNGRQYAFGVHMLDEETIDIIGLMRVASGNATPQKPANTKDTDNPDQSSSDFDWFDEMFTALNNGEDAPEVEKIFAQGEWLTPADFSGVWNVKAINAEDPGQTRYMSIYLKFDGEEVESYIHFDDDEELELGGMLEYEDDEGMWIVELEDEDETVGIELGWFVENGGVQYAIGSADWYDDDVVEALGLTR